MRIKVNGETVPVPLERSTATLLFYLREELGLTGAKYGCGVGQCGACTVLVEGEPVRSCITQIGDLDQQSVDTIEGLDGDENAAKVRAAWIETAVAQCGYCQAGQIISAVSLISKNPQPTDDDINAAMDGNLCRCGTYNRIRKAIKRASGQEK